MLKKRITALCTLIFLFLNLCSCSLSGEKNEQEPVAKTATGSDGKTYSVVVDGDGFLALGDKDFLAVCVEDENGNPGKNSKGEYVTRAVPFPETLTVGKEIHTKFFRMALPDGWTSVSDDLVKLTLKKGDMTASLTVNDRTGSSVKECKEEVKKLMSGVGEGTEEKVKLAFAEAVKLNYENKIAVYIFEKEDRVYFVKIYADEKLFEEVNFEEIINTIKFRKGE